jgi:hypothetical protein
VAKKKASAQCRVIDLADVRARLRLAHYQDKIAAVIDANQATLSHLFTSGAIYSQDGSRAGRNLLLAHQYLLRVLGLIDELAGAGDLPAPRIRRTLNASYAELDGLVEKASALTERTGQALARWQR